jgi:hypothetical protein
LLKDLPDWATPQGVAGIQLGAMTVTVGDDGELSSKRLQGRVAELEKQLAERSPMPKWRWHENDRVRLQLDYESPLNDSEGVVKERKTFYGLGANGEWRYVWVYDVAWTAGELVGQTTAYSEQWLRECPQEVE